jgi:hypothetical protein
MIAELIFIAILIVWSRGLSMEKIRKSLKDIKESPVSKACRKVLKKNHIPHWRNNVLHGLFRGFKEKSLRAVITGTRGMGDISFVMTDGSGRTAYLETKRPVGGVQSDDQKDFEAMCIKWGCPYYMVSSECDLIEILEIHEMLEG